jgi:hypothetical protein
VDLKLTPEGERKDRLKALIVKANSAIKAWAFKHKDKRICYYEGITIPFRRERGESFNSTLLVNIIED